jgi:geranylgeranyl reductase family protein
MGYDVAIIGAGPAGSTAAAKLAAAGVRVALVDQAVFPRDKTCGDGVSGKGLAILTRLGLSTWIEQFLRPRELRLRGPDGESLDGRAIDGDATCYGRLIPRRLLDDKLVRVATGAGAELVENTRVETIETSNGSLRLVTSDSGLEARLAILCDGSHAWVTRRLGLARGRPELFAVRQYLKGDTGPTGRMEIHFIRPLLPHYGWLFPMGEGRINAGIVARAAKALRCRANAREMLACFLADPAVTGGRLVQAEPAGPVRGYPLRARFGATQTHTAHILVAGDAAGLVNPLSGEGIAPAMESGELAAAHALRALESGDTSARALAPYSRALQARFGADRQAARFLQVALSSSRLLNRILRRLKRDEALAHLIGRIIIGHASPRQALRPTVLLRLLA